MKPILKGFSLFIIMLTYSADFANAADNKALNPDIGINLLGLLTRDIQGSNDRTAGSHNGLSFQEAEMQFISNVDPFFRASALFSISQADGSAEFGFEPEEVYLETLSLPAITLRAGKFKAAFGKHNQLHTHAFPFIDAPLINTDLLEGEGLNDMGVSGALLIPAPWFLELTVQALNASNATLFNSPNSGDLAGVASLKNLWDLSGDLTLEWGVYGTRGPNQYESTTSAYGSDLTFKWRPAEGGKYTALIWHTQYLKGVLNGKPEGDRLGGLASWLQYQFGERWWIQARGEYEGYPHADPLPWKTKQSFLLGFFPSEFSGLRMQYDHLLIQDQPVDHVVSLQYNISIGAHPAHAY